MSKTTDLDQNLAWGIQVVKRHLGPPSKHFVESLSLLQSHVQKFQAPGMVGSVSVVEFWLLTLCSLPKWYR